MDKKVVIDSSLRDHIEFLENSGYEVEQLNSPINSNDLESFDVDAIVVSNMNNMSINEPSYRPSAPVVEAGNKTPEEVFNILRGRY